MEPKELQVIQHQMLDAIQVEPTGLTKKSASGLLRAGALDLVYQAERSRGHQRKDGLCGACLPRAD